MLPGCIGLRLSSEEVESVRRGRDGVRALRVLGMGE